MDRTPATLLVDPADPRQFLFDFGQDSPSPSTRLVLQSHGVAASLAVRIDGRNTDGGAGCSISVDLKLPNR